MGIIGLYLVLIRVILERLNNSFGIVCASIFDEPWEWLPATIIAAAGLRRRLRRPWEAAPTVINGETILKIQLNWKYPFGKADFKCH